VNKIVQPLIPQGRRISGTLTATPDIGIWKYDASLSILRAIAMGVRDLKKLILYLNGYRTTGSGRCSRGVRGRNRGRFNSAGLKTIKCI
jgi:hypothetical protein